MVIAIVTAEYGGEEDGGNEKIIDLTEDRRGVGYERKRDRIAGQETK